MVTFNKKYLMHLLGGDVDEDKLVDEIGKFGINVEKVDKDEISVEITSNRPDLVSAAGFARAVSLYSHKIKRYHYSVKDPEPMLEINVGKDARKVRQCIASFVVLGMHFTNESLTELLSSMDKFTETYGRARKKIAIGMHNLDAIKAPLYYDAYANESYLPLNSKTEMTYEEVLKSTEKGIKYSGTIPSGKGRVYPALKDSQGTLALIPVLNSERTKVSVSTKNVLVDVTGPSEYMINKTADMLASIFIDMGGDVKVVQINYPEKGVRTPVMAEHEIQTPTKLIESEIGVAIGSNNVASLAAKMGYEAAILGKKIRFIVPAYRLDVINEQDIVEDIAIAYGYDYIQPVAIKATQTGTLDSETIYRSKVSEIMIGLGFNQLMNSYLTNEKTNFSDMRLENDKSAVKIRNPKSESITIMRTWLIPSLLKDIALSLNEKTPLNAFELDMAFTLKSKKPKESHHLAAVSTNPKANFNSIKSIFESLADRMRIQCKVEAHYHRSFIEGRCAKVTLNGKEIGFFGEVHPEVLNSFGIEEPTVAMELEISSA